MVANDFKLLLDLWAEKMKQNKERLIELDSVVGDSDLGLTMSDGFAAAADSVKNSTEVDLGKLLYNAGKEMSRAVPSTMGTLMASGFMQAGKVLKNTEILNQNEMSSFFKAYIQGIQHRGKAEIGDKTVLDGLYPAVQKMEQTEATGANILDIAKASALAAREGYLATKGMLAKHGRAAGRGEASRDLLDPGAAVAVILIDGYLEFVQKNHKEW